MTHRPYVHKAYCVDSDCRTRDGREPRNAECALKEVNCATLPRAN